MKKETVKTRVHLNFEENQEFNAFWEWGIGNWEWERECFYKYEMLPKTQLKLAKTYVDRLKRNEAGVDLKKERSLLGFIKVDGMVFDMLKSICKAVK